MQTLLWPLLKNITLNIFIFYLHLRVLNVLGLESSLLLVSTVDTLQVVKCRFDLSSINVMEAALLIWIS